MAGKRISEFGIGKEIGKLISQIPSQSGVGSGDFFAEFRAAINHSDDVFEIMARLEVALAPTMKSLQLGSEKVRRGNTRISRPRISRFIACSTAGLYHLLLNPRMPASTGIRSTIKLSMDHLQINDSSCWNPNWRISPSN